MARDDPMMRFRAPADLKARIEEAAAKNGRSLNAEIVMRLEASFNPSEPFLSDNDREILHRMASPATWKDGLRELLDALDEKRAKE